MQLFHIKMWNKVFLCGIFGKILVGNKLYNKLLVKLTSLKVAKVESKQSSKFLHY